MVTVLITHLLDPSIRFDTTSLRLLMKTKLPPADILIVHYGHVYQLALMCLLYSCHLLYFDEDAVTSVLTTTLKIISTPVSACLLTLPTHLSLTTPT